MKKPNLPRSKNPSPHKRRRKGLLRFPEIEGKTVEFVEVDMNFDFPCVEIGFRDKTALHLLLGIAGFTVEPQYSIWKAGNERVLKSWPEIRSES